MDRPVVYDKAKYHYDSVAELGLREEQAAVHTAFFLGWLMDNDLVSVEFRDDTSAEIEAYRSRKRTALDIYGLWDYCLVDDMLNKEGNAFAAVYFDFSTGQYLTDYLDLLGADSASEFHIEYSWESQSTINERISNRYADWKKSPTSELRPKAHEKSRSTAPSGRATAERKTSSRPEQKPQMRSKMGAETRRKLMLFVVFPVSVILLSLLVIWFANSQ